MSRNSRQKTVQKRKKKRNSAPKRKPPEAPSPEQLAAMKVAHEKRMQEERRDRYDRRKAFDLATPQTDPSMFRKFAPITEKRNDGD